MTGNSGCVGCNADATSSQASTAATACECNAGFTGPNGGTRSECVAGTYKDAVGPDPCTDCAQYETSPQGSVSAEACVCVPGYAHAGGGTCVACEAGKYKSANTDTVCDGFCPADSTSLAGSDALAVFSHGIYTSGQIGTIDYMVPAGYQYALAYFANCYSSSDVELWHNDNQLHVIAGTTNLNLNHHTLCFVV